VTARLEVERVVADWLISDVNARIAVVPRDSADPVPPAIAAFSDPLYPNTLIGVFDPTRHPWVAEKKEPPVSPALYVMCQGPVLMMGEPYPAGQIRATTAPIRVAIRYLTTNRDAAVARRDGCYTLRGVARSLRQLDKNEQSETGRLRNSIWFVLGEDPIEFHPVIETIGNARVSGAVVVHYLARDGAPEF